MKSKKLLKILILLSIIIIAIILIIIVIVAANSKKIISKYSADPPTENIPVKVDSGWNIVQNRTEYYIVKKSIEDYYKNCSGIYASDVAISQTKNIDEATKTNIKSMEQQSINTVYNTLDQEYIKYGNVTVNNLNTKIPKINESTVTITDMYVSQKNTNMSAYMVSGYLRDKNTGKIDQFYMLVNLDMNSKAYSIIPQDYIQAKYGSNIKLDSNTNIYIPEKVDSNNYNTFQYTSVPDNIYVQDMFDNYLENMIYNGDYAYNLLDQNYKQKRFGTINNFTNYVTQNKDELGQIYKMDVGNYSDSSTKNDANSSNIGIGLKKYMTKTYDNYTQYVCIDKDNNYYIFNETAPMKYTVMLDSYTIDTPEFTDQYNSVTDIKKVAMNIEKIREAINAKDYNYVYNKLDSTFKNNYFPTQDKMADYLKTNLFDINNFDNTDINNQNGTYLFTLKVTDGKNDSNNNTKNMNMVMKLGQGTDFVMSFSMQ